MISISQHQSSLIGQVKEALMIGNSKDCVLLNSKEEYTRCFLPQLSVEEWPVKQKGCSKYGGRKMKVLNNMTLKV